MSGYIKGHQAFILKYIFFNNKKYENKKCNINKDNILNKNNRDFLHEVTPITKGVRYVLKGVIENEDSEE